MIIIKEARSPINTEILPLAIEYVSKVNRMSSPMIFLGSWAFNFEMWLGEKHPEVHKGVHFNNEYEYEKTYGNRWFKNTFYKAIETVYGKSWLAQAIANNKKK